MIKEAQSTFAFCAQPLFQNTFSHTGGAVGASSVLLIEPERELVIALITNLQNAGGIYRIAMDVAKELTKENLSIEDVEQRLKKIKIKEHDKN